MSGRFRIGILLSGKGRGSNMQALIDATRDGRIPGEVALVVSTSPGAPALERARAARVETRLLSAKAFPDQAALDTALANTFEDAGVKLICLAGYMRLLGPEFLERFRGRVLNVHPALLPEFGGKGFYGHHVHEKVLAAGAKESGVTIHFVDEVYDHGPALLERRVPVLPDDTPESLAARVLAEEHCAYPEAVRLFVERVAQTESG
jgi:phosphoribosylglycinamide formyltransferase 1